MPGISAGKSRVFRVIRMRPVKLGRGENDGVHRLEPPPVTAQKRGAAADFFIHLDDVEKGEKSLRPVAIVGQRPGQHLDPGQATDIAAVIALQLDIGAADIVQRIEQDVGVKNRLVHCCRS